MDARDGEGAVERGVDGVGDPLEQVIGFGDGKWEERAAGVKGCVAIA